MTTLSRRLIIVLLLAVFAVILIRTAWMSDDAYITLRTVDNWINGYGPTWNVGERVQSFTHPLWMLLLSVFYFVTREAYFTTLALSIVISLAALFLLMGGIARTRLAAAAGGADTHSLEGLRRLLNLRPGECAHESAPRCVLCHLLALHRGPAKTSSACVRCGAAGDQPDGCGPAHSAAVASGVLSRMVVHTRSTPGRALV